MNSVIGRLVEPALQEFSEKLREVELVLQTKPRSAERRRLEFERRELQTIVQGFDSYLKREAREERAETIEAENPPRDTHGRFREYLC